MSTALGRRTAVKSHSVERAISVAVLILGIGTIWEGISYRVGTATQMGPGFVPVTVGGLLVVLGIFLILSNSAASAGAREKTVEIGWRPLVAVIGSIGGFIAGMAVGGLIPAVIITVVISSLGDPDNRWISIAISAVAQSLAAWALFKLALGMNIPLLRMPF